MIGLYFNPLLKGSRTVPVFRFLFPASSRTTPTCFVSGFQLTIFPSRVSEKTSSSFHQAGPDIKSVLLAYQYNRLPSVQIIELTIVSQSPGTRNWDIMPFSLCGSDKTVEALSALKLRCAKFENSP